MSDYEDEMMASTGQRLAEIYAALALCCASLPLPIALPTGIVSNLEAVPAVRRIEQLADEQPMPEDQQSQVYSAAMLWLAAMDLYRIQVDEGYVEARASGILGILLISENALRDLGEWLLEQAG